MAASAPAMVLPAMVTVLLVPIVLVANVAVALAVLNVTVSPVSLPTSAAELLFNNAVASTVESYTRSLAVIPLTVSVFTVMLAVVVGWVSV